MNSTSTPVPATPKRRKHRLVAMIETGGCPHMCPHCARSGGPTRKMPHDEIKGIAAQFRYVVAAIDNDLSEFIVYLWALEPDFRDDYRQLWDIANELSDSEHRHGEEVSILRLNSDGGYVEWLKSVGIDHALITFFGHRRTHDGIVGNSGSFDARVEGMRRLVDADIPVDWRLMFTPDIVPDLRQLMELGENMGLPELAEQKGRIWRPVLGEIAPTGRGWNMDERRPAKRHLDEVRNEFGQDRLEVWGTETEGDLTAQFLRNRVLTEDDDEEVFLLVDSSHRVFPQLGQFEPWFCIGDLDRDAPELIIDKYDSPSGSFGQSFIFGDGPARLAKLYGDIRSDRLYQPGSLVAKWIRTHWLSNPVDRDTR